MSIKQLYVFLLTMTLGAFCNAYDNEAARVAERLTNTSMMPTLNYRKLIRKRDRNIMYVVIGTAVLIGVGYVIKNHIRKPKKSITVDDQCTE